LAIGIICILALIVVLAFAAVLLTVRDGKLKKFRFKLSAALLEIVTFGVEVESEREPDELPPGETGPLRCAASAVAYENLTAGEVQRSFLSACPSRASPGSAVCPSGVR
jgi:hypothetical protein